MIKDREVFEASDLFFTIIPSGALSEVKESIMLLDKRSIGMDFLVLNRIKNVIYENDIIINRDDFTFDIKSKYPRSE